MEIPSIFDRNEFYSVLLPGYVNVIVALILFFSSFLRENTATSELFSAVFFLVAGPAVGMMLGELYSTLDNLGDKIRGIIQRDATLNQWPSEYSLVHLVASDHEKAELDNAIANRDFDIGTALGLLIQAVASLLLSQTWLIPLALIGVSLLLLYGGHLELAGTIGPIFYEIEKNHSGKK